VTASFIVVMLMFMALLGVIVAIPVKGEMGTGYRR
jgi:hypothetical protein